ncbi:MAG: HAD family hydrolase [Gemmatimonadota bacterium]
MKLVLFDIDGTLLLTDGTGRRSMEQALTETYGTPGDTSYRYDGKTDQQITREQMRAAGIDDATIDARMDAALDRYIALLSEELERSPEAATLLAGVPELLDALEASGDVTLGLLTGNVERGARQKLRAVGLDFSRFRVNAFGCDHADRPELPAVAQRRAREILGIEMHGERMVIIGDTPFDIHCGRALGVRAIGVATGRYGVDELAEHAPAAVFPTLEDTDAVVGAILR